MPKKQIKKPFFPISDLETYVRKEVERTGKSKEVIIEETFHDGWLSVSETDEGFKVDTSQLFKGDPPKDPLSECRRLRKEFGPISAAVDYVKDIILGGGIDVFIKEPKDEHQKKLKEELLEWMRLVYQDNYTRKFSEIANILVDEALTVGFAAAEIVYAIKPKNNSFFDDYTKPITQSIMTKQGEKFVKQDVVTYDITEPDWKDLQGISRLKILRDAINRLKLYRTPSWEANYLTLDEPNQTPQNMPVESQIVAQSLNKTAQINQGKPSAILLPWQVFSLALNRREWDEKGVSIILPALSTVQLLEKIMKAVGEGIHRAGNKKYFIVCGTEKRPWSPVHIRNLLSQLKEASEKSWSTIPVPSGFDIKEAGGEVFEAQNAVDYFLRIIAGSLHISPSVLGVDFKEIVKSDVPHYTYRRMQDAFRTAIETQVFRLHIWAKFGAKRGKQGGHEDPQYIPEARIKSEALLSEQAKLAMHIQILNVANPVRPEVKLEVERDIAALMGWDILLPTQEEYKTEMDKADAELKAQLAAKATKAEIPSVEQPQVDGEKFQGPPKPPSEEQLAKRQEGGVNVRKVGSKKGQAKPMGDTRMVQESEEEIIDESIEESVCEPQKLEITVKTETKPQEVIVKAESHGMTDEIMTELAKERIELAKKQKELTEKEQELAIEESKKHQEKIQSEIENIKIAIEETRRTIEQKTFEMEKTKAETERIKMESDEIKKTHEAETEKIKIESEEIKKTHAKKRKIMEKLEEKLERDKIVEGEK